MRHAARRPVALALALALLAGPGCARSGPESPAADGTPSDGSGVAFASLSYEDALARARREKKLVFVDVYTDWCGFCKKLDREVFTDSDVARAASRFVAIRVNAEKGGEAVAARFGVRGYPTLLFVDADGELVEKVEGYLDADELVRILRKLPRSAA